jgi:hypothetical protein
VTVRRAGALAGPAAAALLAAAVPLAWLLSGRALAWKDTAVLYAPVRGLVVSALRELRLPLWNPHEALGMPLFAQLLHGVLHPVSVAAALVAPGASLDALAVVHVALGAAGAALLAARLGAAGAACSVAGLAFGVSGYVLGMAGNFMYLASAATAPWAAAGLLAAGAGGRSGIPLGALGTAAALLAGDPQWAAVACALGIALAWERSGERGAARAAGSVALGALLAGAQLAPTLALWRETARAAGLVAEDGGEWSLAPARLAELVAPGFFSGAPGESLVAPVYQWLGRPGERYAIPFSPSVYVGAAALALAALGARRRGAPAVLAGGAALSLWLALGPALGASAISAHVPLWGSFRYPEKLVGPLTLCVALLAALGAERLRAGVPRALPRGALAGALAALAAAGAASYAIPYAGGGEAARLAGARLGGGLVHAAAALGAVAALAAAARRWPAAARHAPALVAAAVLADGAAAARHALHAGAPGVRDEAPLGALLAGADAPRLAHPVPVPRGFGPPSLDESDRLLLVESAMALPSFNVASRADALDGYTGLMPRRYKRLDLALGDAFGEARYAAARRFSTSHVVIPRDVEAPFAERVQRALQGGRPVPPGSPWLAVFEVPHRPRALFAEGVRLASGEEAAATELVRAIAAGSPDVVVEAPATAVPARPAPGRVLRSERGEAWLRVEGESAGEGLLVVNDACWPGWRARLDGRPVRAYCADVAVRAVAWPAGRHVLELRYEPPELAAGLLASALGALGVAIAWALGGRRAAREPAA